MEEVGIPVSVDQHRRRLFGAGALTLAATRLGMTRSAAAQSGNTKTVPPPTVAPGTNSTFGPLKRLGAGVLNVGYADVGPADGRPAILLHGWPYDIHSFVDAAPMLASAGYRVIVPYLRGYGATRFLSDATPRNGQPSAVAVDVIALMDALAVHAAVVSSCVFSASLTEPEHASMTLADARSHDSDGGLLVDSTPFDQ